MKGHRRAWRNLTIAVLNDADMAGLNWRHLRHRGPTDVLAFPDPPEIAVCLGVARRQARSLHIPWQHELARYVVHGCLHLLGHDDHAPGERARMWKRQEAIVRALSGIRA